MPDPKKPRAAGKEHVKRGQAAPQAPAASGESVGERPYAMTAHRAPVFFVVGRAKSGTSWLMQTLDAHPEILCRGEGRFFGRDYRRDAPARLGPARPEQRSLYGALADSEPFRDWIETSVWRGRGDAEEHLANVTGLLTDYFLKKRLYETGKSIVGDKTPFTGADVVKEIARIRPDAKVIHVIRDGRDVAVSSAHHVWNNARDEGGVHDLSPEELAKREAYRSDPPAFAQRGESIFAGGRLTGAARSWANMVGRAMEDGPRLLGDDYAEARYEDLLEKPEEEVGRLLRFLGADAREETVRGCVEAASFERRAKGRQRGREDPKAFLRKGVAGDWRGVFTGGDKEVFKREAGDLLVKLGYEDGYDW